MGSFQTEDGIQLHYDEYGAGNRIILSAQVGFDPAGIQQELAKQGYRVFCLTLRGFAPSGHVTEDYGSAWYDIFADDVIRLADELKINQFCYLGASHGAGIGWHLTLRHPERVSAFIAIVPGPHSLEDGILSYRQMLLQGLISAPPPFDPPVDKDPARERRRQKRQRWLDSLPAPDPLEAKIDYGRPLMDCGTEKKLREKLSSIQTPVLILGGSEDPISTPALMMRTACCLPHCKLVMYSNCGHNIDTDLTEELAAETDRFLSLACSSGKWYAPVKA